MNRKNASSGAVAWGCAGAWAHMLPAPPIITTSNLKICLICSHLGENIRHPVSIGVSIISMVLNFIRKWVFCGEDRTQKRHRSLACRVQTAAVVQVLHERRNPSEQATDSGPESGMEVVELLIRGKSAAVRRIIG